MIRRPIAARSHLCIEEQNDAFERLPVN